MAELHHIVNLILKIAQDSDILIRPMKLQKLLWFSHGFYSVRYNPQGLISETFEAWPYGPVIPSVYHIFKFFYSRPITKFIYDMGYNYTYSTNANINQICFEIMRTYGKLTDLRLSELTHTYNGAWWRAFNNFVDVDIQQNDILEEFSVKKVIHV